MKQTFAEKKSLHFKSSITQACTVFKYLLLQELTAFYEVKEACCTKPLNPSQADACNYEKGGIQRELNFIST